MELFQTNAALGYGEYAYLLKVSETQFLVIDNNLDCSYENYRIGSIEIFNIEDQLVYLEETDYELLTSPLNGTFLFDTLIKSLDS